MILWIFPSFFSLLSSDTNSPYALSSRKRRGYNMGRGVSESQEKKWRVLLDNDGVHSTVWTKKNTPCIPLCIYKHTHLLHTENSHISQVPAALNMQIWALLALGKTTPDLKFKSHLCHLLAEWLGANPLTSLSVVQFFSLLKCQFQVGTRLTEGITA